MSINIWGSNIEIGQNGKSAGQAMFEKHSDPSLVFLTENAVDLRQDDVCSVDFLFRRMQD